MINPISPNRCSPISPLPAAPAPKNTPGKDAGTDFAATLREQLDRVNEMQAEADQGIQNLLTGRTDNYTAVFTAARKAEVAFGLLMEIRNKLVDAYIELRQMRV